MATQRLFIAVPCTLPTPELDAHLGTLPADAWRTVQPGQRHVTLAFLGALPDGVDKRLAQVLDAGLADQAGFFLDLAGLGAFPDRRGPTALWAGCASGTEPMVALAARVRDALHRVGFSVDRRPLRAHVTLARRRSRVAPQAAARDAASWLRAGTGRVWARMRVLQVVLWRSQLDPGGARYTELGSWPLAGRRAVP